MVSSSPKSPHRSEYLLIGLGNPPHEYSETWHNLGAMYIQNAISTLKNSGYILETTHLKKRIRVYRTKPSRFWLVYPTNIYMNLSSSILKIIYQSKILAQIDTVFIVHDDISINDIQIITNSTPNLRHKGVASVYTSLNKIPTLHVNYIKIGVPYSKLRGAATLSEFILQKIPINYLSKYKDLMTKHFTNKFLTS